MRPSSLAFGLWCRELRGMESNKCLSCIFHLRYNSSMKFRAVLQVLADITAVQWGMVTSAQAANRGVSRLQLSRLTESGQLIRIVQGVYMDAGAPTGPFDDLRAAWLSTEPKILGEERIKKLSEGVVVASSSAAYLHGIGDLWPDRHEFVAARRHQTQRKGIRYRQRVLEPQDVTVVEGLPTLTLERTIADLVDDVGDLSLVGDSLRDASLKRDLDYAQLRGLLGSLAARHGFAKSDGSAFLERLQQIARIDKASVAHRIASDPSLSSRIVSTYLESVIKGNSFGSLMTPELQKTVADLQKNMTETLIEAISQQVDPLMSETDAAMRRVLGTIDVSQLAEMISRNVLRSDVVQKMAAGWLASVTNGSEGNAGERV